MSALNFVVVLTQPTLMSDGTTQPAGTVVNRIIAEPTFDAGPNTRLQPDTGQQLYVSQAVD